MGQSRWKRSFLVFTNNGMSDLLADIFCSLGFCCYIISLLFHPRPPPTSLFSSFHPFQKKKPKKTGPAPNRLAGGT